MKFKLPNPRLKFILVAKAAKNERGRTKKSIREREKLGGVGGGGGGRLK